MAQLLPVTSRILEIENALAVVLHRSDFEVVTREGQRFLRPISAVDDVNSLPLLPLDLVARDLERLLS